MKTPRANPAVHTYAVESRRISRPSLRECFAWAFLALGIGWVAPAAPATPPDAAAVAACAACHGPAGAGNATAGFPRLAGLGGAYLQRQLAAFAEGTRVNAVMMPIAKALSAAEQTELSQHYANLPVPAAVPAPAPVIEQTAAAAGDIGATLATQGRWADALPACDQCHGPAGRGVGPDFPALTGQGAGYLAGQLTAWKTGQRPPGPMGLMAGIARKLSDAEVQAVAAHYASLDPGATR